MAQSEKDKVTGASATNDDPGVGASTASAAHATPEGSEAAGSPAAAADAQDAKADKLEADAAEYELDAELADEAGFGAESAFDEREAVAAAQAEVAEWKDKYMRLHAEWDTYRRRTNEQRAAEKVRATEKLVTNLLPVLDDFERTIDYAQKNGEEGLLGGVEAVHTKLVDALRKDGVEVINPEGQAFDALEAQAVSTVDDATVPDETVAQVYQLGYRMGEKVLRPAMVTVTTGGPKRPPEPEDSGDE